MRVLVACEFSGIVRRAFRALGCDAWSCDLLPAEDGDPHHILVTGNGLLESVVVPGRWDLMIAHPPCTRLANSGVRWLHVPPPGRTRADMWAEMDAAAAFYRRVRDLPIPRKAIENPVMHKYARERIQIGLRQVVQPWWFGEPAFKATGLELVGLPPLVPTKRLTPPEAGTPEHKAWSKVHMASPGPNRWKERSRTFPGIAAAMAAQWATFSATHPHPAGQQAAPSHGGRSA